MKRVLFVCVHNSARSQMAEELLRKYGADEFEAYSAGFETKPINPYAIEAMKEEGIDISNNSVNSVFEYFKEGKRFNYIVTVCDEGQSQRCPIFPGINHRIHWSFEDPSSLEGDEQSNIAKTIEIKNQIKKEVLHFIELVKADKIKENYPSNWIFG